MARILDVSADEISATTPLCGNEKWDSFAVLSAVAFAIEHTGRQLTIKDLSSLETVEDFLKILRQ